MQDGKRPPLTLGERGERILKLVHVAGAGAAFGGALCMLLLIVVKGEFSADEDLFLLDFAAFRLFGSIVTWGFGVALASGAGYALFTARGLWRERWITAKWIISLLLLGAAPLWLVPALNSMAALGDAGLDEDTGVYWQLTVLNGGYLGVGAIALLALIALSVFKPWGAHRRQFGLPPRRTRIGAAAAVVAVVVALYGRTLYLDAARGAQIEDVDPSALADGAYRGAAHCMGADYRVQVYIEGGEITHIEVLDRPDSLYAELAERILPRIVDGQSIAVDAITGATTTGKCLLKAVERALTARREAVT